MATANLLFELRTWLCSVIMCVGFTLHTLAQECPPNLDFERGTFDQWVTYTGAVIAASGTNVMVLNPGAPQPGRHELLNGLHIPDNWILLEVFR